MKSKFQSYLPPSSEVLKQIWSDSKIAFDSNVLRDLYGFSEQSTTEINSLLEIYSQRLWLPHQCANEYFDGRPSEIRNQAKKYDEITKQLESLQIALDTRTNHPFISEQLKTEFAVHIEKICTELVEGKNRLLDYIENDPIRDKLLTLFDGKVGDALNADALDTLFSEGKVRYADKIPPGYMDSKKGEPLMYGDLIIWNEILNHAKNENSNFIFVTNDSKEDWWSKSQDKTLGPHPKLLSEFRNFTGKEIYIYSFESFLNWAKNHGERISNNLIEEAQNAEKRRNELDVDEVLRNLTSSPSSVADDIINNPNDLRSIQKPALRPGVPKWWDALHQPNSVDDALRAAELHPTLADDALRAAGLNPTLADDALRAAGLNPTLTDDALRAVAGLQPRIVDNASRAMERQANIDDALRAMELIEKLKRS